MIWYFELSNKPWTFIELLWISKHDSLLYVHFLLNTLSICSKYEQFFQYTILRIQSSQWVPVEPTIKVCFGPATVSPRTNIMSISIAFPQLHASIYIINRWAAIFFFLPSNHNSNSLTTTHTEIHTCIRRYKCKHNCANIRSNPLIKFFIRPVKHID